VVEIFGSLNECRDATPGWASVISLDRMLVSDLCQNMLTDTGCHRLRCLPDLAYVRPFDNSRRTVTRL
jgi:hypothetical protein